MICVTITGIIIWPMIIMAWLQVPFTRVVYIEETDFREKDDKDFYGLAPGKSIMLRCVGGECAPGPGYQWCRITCCHKGHLARASCSGWEASDPNTQR
jgi:hypothetical protein